jgi:Flp pilus assembly CpaE family ATPase
MSSPLLATKLHILRLCPNLVPRPHLIQKRSAVLLRQSASPSEGRIARTMTLIYALGGFGKTTLAVAVRSGAD